MSVSTRNLLEEYLRKRSARYQLIEHRVCRSAEQSTAARSEAGYPDSEGAKALLVKSKSGFSTLVLHADVKFDRGRVKKRLGGDFRFASADELMELTKLEYGMMPPFGPSLFPQIESLFVDTAVLEYPLIGFNACCLDHSIVISIEEYLKCAKPTEIISLANSD